MKRTTSFLLTLLFGLLLLTGCEDGLVGQDTSEQETFAETQRKGKLRHAHLMKGAFQQADGAGKGGEEDERVGLIVALEKQAVLERYKILERYKVMERYKILERYEYEHVFDGFAITADAEELNGLLAEMALDPAIAWIEPDFSMRVVNPNSGDVQNSMFTPWGIGAIGAPAAAERAAPDVDIYVMDTGVTSEHVDVSEAYNFVAKDNESTSDADDFDGHGTHIAGIIAGKNVIDGIARQARVHNLKVVGPNGKTELSTAIAAVEYVTGQKLQHPNRPMVVNLSLGANVYTEENISLDEAIEASIAAGIIYVIAAGNEGVDAEHVSPAHVEEAITVGAYDNASRFASYSNFGHKVDILAPGTDVISLYTDARRPNRFALMSGTSMAAAHVTGAVAVFLQQNPHANAQQVEAALAQSGQGTISGAPGGTTDKTLFMGGTGNGSNDDEGGLLSMQLPPFLQFAITTFDDLKLGDNIYVGLEGSTAANASLYAGGDIRFKGSPGNTRVEGFGYYTGKLKSRDEETAQQVFQPRLNPTSLAPTQEVSALEAPHFEPSAFSQHVTETTRRHLDLKGHYQLGTKENPTVWYVKGDLRTRGDVSFSGYGIFLVEGDIMIKHNVTTDIHTEDNQLGLYAKGDIGVGENGSVNMAAQLLSLRRARFMGDCTLYGSILAVDEVRFDGQITLFHRPPSPVLTDLFWPMQ